jgi:RNA polymerase sigma-70 factor (ECF subfamily)
MRRRLRIIEGGQPTAREETDLSPRGHPAFEEVLLAQLDSLFAFANRLVRGRREEAEDLVQEACVRAFRKYETLRAPEKFKAWLFQILVNTYINETHRHSREPPTVDVELSEVLLTASGKQKVETPEEQLFAKVLDSEVQKALDALPVEFRTVVWLSDVEEMNYREICEIMNCPPGTVASRIYRGHSMLREHLREYARQRGLMSE